MDSYKLRDAHFSVTNGGVLCGLQTVSENNTPRFWPADQAMISLSRVLGDRCATADSLIADAELDRLVHALLRTVPLSSSTAPDNRLPVSFASLAPGRSHVRRTAQQPTVVPIDSATISYPAEVDLEPAISLIAERAQTLTGASGAAIALRKGEEMVCRARAGRNAPDVGVRLQSDSGISADCVRTGQVVLCRDAQYDPHVDMAACQRLGVRSILAAPLRHFRRTLGVFEVFSSVPHAFADRDVATMQLLSSVMVAALSRLAPRRQTA
jgi:putative methionine-R-sulfoxide reductase with GAF domain